jgi:hypothetical protein
MGDIVVDCRRGVSSGSCEVHKQSVDDGLMLGILWDAWRAALVRRGGSALGCRAQCKWKEIDTSRRPDVLTRNAAGQA